MTFGKLTSLDHTFQYLTPVLKVRPSDLCPHTTLSARAFHTLASRSELVELVTSLLALRTQHSLSDDKPFIVWEPRPTSCTPELPAFLEAVKLVDVVSPNPHELAWLCGKNDEDKEAIEKRAMQVLEKGIGPKQDGAIIVRAGEKGCLVLSTKIKAIWLPACYGSLTGSADSMDKSGYYDRDEGSSELQERGIVDPTGAGNAFLGAFTIGLLDTRNLMKAACYGNVGAFFALEQVGLPQLKTAQNGKEVWHGIDPMERLERYQSRLGSYHS